MLQWQEPVKLWYQPWCVSPCLLFLQLLAGVIDDLRIFSSFWTLLLCCVSGRAGWPAVWPDVGILSHSGQFHRLPGARLAHHHPGLEKEMFLSPQMLHVSMQSSKELMTPITSEGKTCLNGWFRIRFRITPDWTCNRQLNWPQTLFCALMHRTGWFILFYIGSVFLVLPPPCLRSWKCSWRNAKWPITASRYASC